VFDTIAIAREDGKQVGELVRFDPSALLSDAWTGHLGRAVPGGARGRHDGVYGASGRRGPVVIGARRTRGPDATRARHARVHRREG